MTLDNETILQVAREEFGELNPQFLSPQVFMRFAHRITALQREIDAQICEGLPSIVSGGIGLLLVQFVPKQ